MKQLAVSYINTTFSRMLILVYWSKSAFICIHPIVSLSIAIFGSLYVLINMWIFQPTFASTGSIQQPENISKI